MPIQGYQCDFLKNPQTHHKPGFQQKIPGRHKLRLISLLTRHRARVLSPEEKRLS